MKRFEKNKETLLKYGFSDETADLLILKGYTKTKLSTASKKELLEDFPEDIVNEIKEKTVRQPIPEDVFDKLVKETELHCPFCWNYKEELPIIIHHIDPYNETQDNTYHNLIVLCLNHHAEVHTKREISQNNFPKARLLTKKEEWIQALKEYKTGNRPAPGEETDNNKSKIQIKQNINGKICEPLIQTFYCDFLKDIELGISEIITDQINVINVHKVKDSYNYGDRSPNSLGVRMGISYTPIFIEDETKKEINDFSKNENVPLNSSFFNLGQLEEISPMPIYDSDGLSGTDMEKDKYYKIYKLHENILIKKDLKAFSENFENRIFFCLVLSNKGSTYDEDIDVTLYFPKDSILFPNDFPIPNRNLIDEPRQICEKLLETVSNHNIDDYPDINPYIHSSFSFIPTYSFLNNKTEEEIYEEKIEEYLGIIKELFSSFEFFRTAEEDVVKFHQDYLKHNITNNFPTIIISSENIEKISYCISTKNHPQMITGEVHISK